MLRMPGASRRALSSPSPIILQRSNQPLHASGSIISNSCSRTSRLQNPPCQHSRSLVRAVRFQSTQSTPHQSSPSSTSSQQQSPQNTQQRREQHAVSNPTLANIEKRWDGMPPQEQAELWMALRDRMTVDWHQMTMQEKRAAYWIAFGPHGPRALPPPGEGWAIFRHTMYWVFGSVAVFGVIRYFARGTPKTMTKEWQEATNERLREYRVEPITGLSSEGYQGKGQVQSPPGYDKFKTEDDDG